MEGEKLIQNRDPGDEAPEENPDTQDYAEPGEGAFWEKLDEYEHRIEVLEDVTRRLMDWVKSYRGGEE